MTVGPAVALDRLVVPTSRRRNSHSNRSRSVAVILREEAEAVGVGGWRSRAAGSAETGTVAAA